MSNRASDVELVSSADFGALSRTINSTNNGKSNSLEKQSPPDYVKFLTAFRDSWPHGLPELTISYTNLSFTAHIPLETNEVETVWSAAGKRVSRMVNSIRQIGASSSFDEHNSSPSSADVPRTVEFHGLHSVSGVLCPGEMALILAPPGHGKSMLLKGLAGRLHHNEKDHFDGEVRWNGRTSKELAEAEANSSGSGAAQIAKLTAYVDQGDAHYPMLTVRETFQFAAKQANIDLSGHSTLSSVDDNRVELMIDLLGLRRCADTIVGNAVVRGVSGGERRRVSLGEMLLTNARALFLDEITTGLDAAAAIDIIRAIQTWTRITKGSAMCALLQPAKEMVEMFDTIIMMREGSCLYHGPREAVGEYFNSIGIQMDKNRNIADWTQEFLMAPEEMYLKEQQARKKQQKQQAQLTPIVVAPKQAEVVHTFNGGAVRFHVNEDEKQPNTVLAPLNKSQDAQPGEMESDSFALVTKPPPLTTMGLRQAFVQSFAFTSLIVRKAEAEQGDFVSVEKVHATSHLTQRQYHSAFSRSWWSRTVNCFDRQSKVYRRLPELIVPRIAQAITMGLIGGGLFYQLGTSASDVDPRDSVATFSLALMAFCNSAELPFASEFKMVVGKHMEAGFYSAGNYYASVLAMHLPLAITEVTIFGSLLYWMGNFAPNAGRYFFFLLVMFFQNQLMSSMFRTFAYATQNADAALHLSAPFVALMMLFGGFLITADKIPDWLLEMHYLSPFAWGLRSEILSEFGDSRYDELVTNADGEVMRQGDLNLAVFAMKRNQDYRWAGIAYMAGFFILVSLLATWALARSHQWLTKGTKRFLEHENATKQDVDSSSPVNKVPVVPANDNNGEIRVQIAASTSVPTLRSHASSFDPHPSSSMSALPFTPASLSWNHIGYTVPLPNGDGGNKEKALLNGVSGYARSGELTALMGSSGAGKTTLMDVLAGRKRVGTVSGSISVNGHPQTFPAFARLSAYCQQDDIHLGTETVREAVLFSANLRLDSSVPTHVKEQFVDEILSDLELTQLAHTIIGDANNISLSPGELKRVSIGVELAANPAILFLDEPTSALDSRAALVLLKVIRKVARRGRAVVCTIHQPSHAMFSMFDRLLLLQSGGSEVYFGPVEAGSAVVNYFESVPIPADCVRPSFTMDQNPATWMLEVIGAGTGPKDKVFTDYSGSFKTSPLHKTMEGELELLNQPVGEPARFSNPFAASFSTQFFEVLARLHRMHQRDVIVTAFRLLLTAAQGIIIGLAYGDVNSDNESGMISKLSSMFSVFGFFGYVQCSGNLPYVYKMRHPLPRERQSHMYSSLAFSAAMGIVELPWSVLVSILYGIPVYFLLGMENDAGLFFRFLLIVFTIAYFSSSFGQLLGSFAPNIQVANLLVSVWTTFCFLFGGVFTLKTKLAVGWWFLYYITPLSKAFNALVVQQFFCAIGNPDCPTVVSESFGGGNRMTKWEFAQAFTATGYDWDWYYIGYLGLSIAAVRILVALAVHKQPY